MQRTKSGNFLASLVASGFPAVLQEKLQQRKAPLEDVTFGITHGGNGSTVSMPAAARKSQARMVGARKKCRTAAHQNGRLPQRRPIQRRMVEASGTRSASRQSGAACSADCPSAARAMAACRASKL